MIERELLPGEAELIKEIRAAQAGIDLASAGRGLLLQKAKEAFNADLALHYIRGSTRPSDRFEASQIEKFNKANNELRELYKKHGLI